MELEPGENFYTKGIFIARRSKEVVSLHDFFTTLSDVGKVPVNVVINFEDGSDMLFLLRSGEDLVHQVFQEVFVPEILTRPITDLGFDQRPLTCLKEIDVISVIQLCMQTEIDLRKLPCFGEKSLANVKEILGALGLSLGMEFDFDPFDPNVKLVPKKE